MSRVREKGSNGWRDEDDIILMPVTTAMRRVLGKAHVDSIDIEAASAEVLEQAQEDVDALTRKLHRIPDDGLERFQIRNMADIQAAVSETNRTMSFLLASIAAISLLVGGIGIMNIMLVSVTERTREIGLRKALGARRRDVLSQFLIEAVLVSATGGLIGIALGGGITFLMARLAEWPTAIAPSSVLLSFFFSAGVGVLFGLWPARKAAALNPIDALRWE
jgi:ABC-type antimicrobial peptide transport system permease subunit